MATLRFPKQFSVVAEAFAIIARRQCADGKHVCVVIQESDTSIDEQNVDTTVMC